MFVPFLNILKTTELYIIRVNFMVYKLCVNEDIFLNVFPMFHLGKNWHYLIKLNISMPYTSETPLLREYIIKYFRFTYEDILPVI